MKVWKMEKNKYIDDLLYKIKHGYKLDSKDLNSNKSFEYDGLESVTENHEKWFNNWRDINEKKN